MDDRTNEPTPTFDQPTDFVQTLREQRGRVRQFVATHRARLDRVEADLALQLERIQRDLAQEREQSSEVRVELTQSSHELAQRRLELEQMQGDLERRQQAFVDAQALALNENEAQSTRLEQQAAALRRQKGELDALAADIASQTAQLTQRQQELATATQEFTAREQAISAQQNSTSASAQAVAVREAEAARCQIELDRRSAELKALQASLEADQARLAQATSLDHATALRNKELEQQLVDIRSQLNQSQLDAQTLLAERQSAQSAFDRQSAQLQELQAAQQADQSQLTQALAQAQAAARAATDQNLALEAQVEQLRLQLSASQSRIEELTLACQQAASDRDATVADQFATVEQLRSELDEQLASRAAAISTAELARDQVTTELTSVRDELAALQQQWLLKDEKEQEVQQTADKQQAELDALRNQLNSATAMLAQRESEIDEQRTALAEALSQLRETQAATAARAQERSAVSDEVARLTKERQLLLARLADAESRAEAKEGEAEAEGRAADFERRYQMALDDLREQQARYAELERKFNQASTKAQVSTPRESTTGMDWESQKRRMLASLESDEGTSLPAQDRLKVEDAIRTTEEAISEKDREIRELRQMLSEQVDHPHHANVDDAEMVAAIDKDLLIQQERIKLQKMQEDVQEKLCRAEVEVSVERAKIARERSQLEEKLRQLQQEQAHFDQGQPADPTQQRKPTRGRWLTRLGLGDQTDE